MPGMSNLQLLEARRQVAPALPVAVITAHAAAGTVTDTPRKDSGEIAYH
jgi:DNA-binding NtrC family response regulator